jgi:glyoxylase-like metal-dependent hydrolase (beta-lactamase superfamily II)
LAICRKTKHAVLIDPVLDYNPNNANTSTDSTDKIIDYIKDRNIKLIYVLETHAHADHLTSAVYIRDKLGAEIAIGERITGVQEAFKKIFNFSDAFNTDGSQFNLLLKNNQTLNFGHCQITTMHTP